MYQDRIEYLKRAIKRTYKRYTGERQDGTASLKDVTSFFNIPVDESRLDDYTVVNIDFGEPLIELVDNKTGTTYVSQYTRNADLLNASAKIVKFNKLLITTPTHTVDSLYYIEEDTPVVERMTFKDGDFDLVFEREYANSIGQFANHGVRLTIKYLQHLQHKGKNVQQVLLTRIYKDSYSDRDYRDSFEELYTYDSNYYIKRADNQDKYTYLRSGTVVYGISEFSQRDDYFSLRGVCFENTNGNIRDYFPLNMSFDSYPALKDKNNRSAMIFSGISDDAYHSLEIYKNGSNAIIVYSKDGKRSYDVLTMPLISAGNISSKEIQIIIASLQEQHNGDKFIGFVSSELSSFGNKIDIKRGVAREEPDMLNPKLFIRKSFDSIGESIDENKDEFFRLAASQFKDATNISDEKGQAKVIMQNNSQN